MKGRSARLFITVIPRSSRIPLIAPRHLEVPLRLKVRQNDGGAAA
jgi:hypothetical protein